MAATLTPNIGLKKPDREDYVSVVSDINDNMDTLDSKIGAVPQNKTVQGQIDSIGTEIGTVPSGKSVQDEIDDINVAIGSTALPTTAQTLTGAVAELDTELDDKVDKVNGKGLSTNDFTDVYKQAVDDAASKVSGGTEGHIVTLDENGNIQDSGKSIDDLSPIDDTAGLGDDDVVWSADKTTKELIKKADRDNVYLFREASGNPCIIRDAVAETVKRIQIELAPKQDLHGYDKPWVGGAGKNLFNYDAWKNTPVTNGTAVYADYGVAVTSANGIAFPDYGTNYPVAARIPLTSGETITLSWECENEEKGDAYIFENGDSSTYVRCRQNLKTLSYTGTANASYVTITFNVLNTGETAIFKNIMVRKSGDATFEPYSNICPISGYTQCDVARTGKNLLEFDQSVTLSGENFIIGGGSVAWINTEHTVLKQGDYCLSFDYKNITSGSSAQCIFYNSSHATKRVVTVAMSGTSGRCVLLMTGITDAMAVCKLQLYCNSSSGGTFSNIQLEAGSTATAYESYVEPQDATYPFPTSAGTVYGGTLTVNRDGSGVLTINRARFQLDEIADFAVSTSSCKIARHYFSNQIVSGVSDNKVHMLSEVLKATAAQSDPYTVGTCYTSGEPNVESVLTVVGPSVTVTEYNSKYAGTYVVCDLITPIVTNLTALEVIELLKGYNTVYTDAGNISLLYPAEKYLTVEQADKERIYESVTTPADIITIQDGADSIPVKQIVFGIEPVQDLHGYDHPWPAGGGKNLIPDTITLESGTYGSAGNKYSDANKVRSNTYISVEASTQYVISCSSGTFSHACFYTDSNVFIERIFSSQFTTPANCSKITFAIDSTDTTIKVQLEKGSTATDYAPYSNICPISGHTQCDVVRTGKNLFDGSFEAQCVMNEIGKYNFNDGHKATLNYIAVKNETNYTLSGTNLYLRYAGTDNGGVRYAFYDKNKKFLYRSDSYISGNVSFTTTADTAYVKFHCGGLAENVQLELGSVASAYEPFTGSTTYPITFPSSAGTVYGGTLTVNRDGTGVLVSKYKRLKLTNVSQLLDFNASAEYGSYAVLTESGSYSDSAKEGVQPIASSMTDICSYNERISYPTKDRCYLITTQSNTKFVTIRARNGVSITTVNELFGYFENIEVVYELATPITYQLSALEVIELLKGTNNIYASTGQVLSADLPRDTKLYIDKKFAELSAAITALGT